MISFLNDDVLFSQPIDFLEDVNADDEVFEEIFEFGEKYGYALKFFYWSH